METIVINENLIIPWGELSLSYACSGGPGGQNVNKVNTKVFLRWNLDQSKCLTRKYDFALRSIVLLT